MPVSYIGVCIGIAWASGIAVHLFSERVWGGDCVRSRISTGREGHMQRNDLTEIHYILPIDNLASVLRLGLLSHNRMKRAPHNSIADEVVQERRKGVVVPQGRPLHDYVNLYFHARNPMMFRRKEQWRTTCVLAVDVSCLDLPRVVITDRNASAKYCLFKPAPGGLAVVNRELVFARSWKDEVKTEYWRKKSIRCAEVLAPDRLDHSYITKIYVADVSVVEVVKKQAGQLPVVVNPDLFFR